MGKNKQLQKAGGNSQQLQAETINITNITQGLTKEDAQKMCLATSQEVAQMYSLQAKEEFLGRVETYNKVLLDRLETIEGALDELKKPEVLRDIMESQKSAGCTDREYDYELLAELIAERTQKTTDRKKALIIRQAVTVIDQIDEEALCALTVFSSFMNLSVTCENIDDGLKSLSLLFDDLLYFPLPTDYSWVEHLKLLNLLDSSAYPKFVDFNMICKQLYKKHLEKGELSIEDFVNKWDSYKSLKLIHDWWDSFGSHFLLTTVGKAVAFCNAQKVSKRFPDAKLF